MRTKLFVIIFLTSGLVMGLTSIAFAYDIGPPIVSQSDALMSRSTFTSEPMIQTAYSKIEKMNHIASFDLTIYLYKKNTDKGFLQATAKPANTLEGVRTYAWYYDDRTVIANSGQIIVDNTSPATLVGATTRLTALKLPIQAQDQFSEMNSVDGQDRAGYEKKPIYSYTGTCTVTYCTANYPNPFN